VRKPKCIDNLAVVLKQQRRINSLYQGLCEEKKAEAKSFGQKFARKVYLN